jgi:uncharacterized protein
MSWARDLVGRRAPLAFLYAVPISILGGLMGLGGAEFRLPVLAGPLGYHARQAVPLNLAVSFLIRAKMWPLDAVAPFLPGALGLINDFNRLGRTYFSWQACRPSLSSP